MISEVKMGILNVVETFHLHRLVKYVHYTVNECSLLFGCMPPAHEDHPLLANVDPLLVPTFHHHHQFLSQVVPIVGLCHDVPRCFIRFISEVGLQLIFITRLSHKSILLNLFPLDFIDCIILSVF